MNLVHSQDFFKQHIMKVVPNPGARTEMGEFASH